MLVLGQITLVKPSLPNTITVSDILARHQDYHYLQFTHKLFIYRANQKPVARPNTSLNHLGSNEPTLLGEILFARGRNMGYAYLIDRNGRIYKGYHQMVEHPITVCIICNADYPQTKEQSNSLKTLINHIETGEI